MGPKKASASGSGDKRKKVMLSLELKHRQAYSFDRRSRLSPR